MNRARNLIPADDQHELDMAAEIADSVAAKVDETLERAPAGAIHEQLVGDMAYAEGVRDALAWATGLNVAADRLTKLLDLQSPRKHAEHEDTCLAAYATGFCICGAR